MFTIPALKPPPATATPATPATPTGAVAPVAAGEAHSPNTATPATCATSTGVVAAVAHVAVADRRLRDPEFRRAIIASRDAAGLGYWRAALLLGYLHLCGNCSRYSFGRGPAGPGSSSMHGDGLLAFLPFDCPEFTVAEIPTAPAFLKNDALAQARQ